MVFRWRWSVAPCSKVLCSSSYWPQWLYCMSTSVWLHGSWAFLTLLSQVGDGHMAGKSFSLADAAIFPIFAYVFYYWYVDLRVWKMTWVHWKEWKRAMELTLWSWLFCLPSSSPSSSPQCEARYPSMAAYYNRLKDRPSIKATWPPARFENPEGMEYIKDCWNDCTTTATTITTTTTTTAARITSYSCKTAAYCNWLGAWDLKKVLVPCANPIKPTLSFPRIVNFTFSICKVLF